MPARDTPIKLVDLLHRIKRHLSREPTQSVLAATAARYGTASSEQAVTPPTGFDPAAAALFESLVETAFLVANADGEFDELERQAFAAVVVEAAERHVTARQVEAIVLDLGTQLEQDGLERRLEMAARGVTDVVDRQEALRIAGFIASISKGVSQSERRVLARLAELWSLPSGAVEVLVHEMAGVLEP
jgi:tellurite resistance protein